MLHSIHYVIVFYDTILGDFLKFRRESFVENKNTITLTNNTTNEKFDFDLIDCTRGIKAIDFRNLSVRTRLFSYDPGFVSTAGCESSISYIDGDNGILLYRGYPVKDLVNKYKFVDICSLLINNELPKNELESNALDLDLRNFLHLDERLINIFKAFPDNAHPMVMLISAVSFLCAFYENYTSIKNDNDYQTMAKVIIAKISTLIAFSYRHFMGYSYVNPDMNLSYVHNFLYMLRASNDKGDVLVDPLEIEALDKILTLHADHGQNASTATVRNVVSTGVHPYAAIGAGLCALWGPAHGGANEKVLNQLTEIDNVNNVNRFIEKAKDKNSSFRLMGFGHRVYKNYDPRAKILKSLKDDLSKKGITMDSRYCEIAEKIEEVALKDDYFIERKLYPNVDFYSGIILSALKIPVNLFTPMFAMGRMPGWCAQLIEHVKASSKISRPLHVYRGK